MRPFQLDLPLPAETSRDPAAWRDALIHAFDREAPPTGFLPLAEEALLAHPANPVILIFAATAALLDARPDRAQVFLKRYAKRLVANETWHLLQALVLAEQDKLIPARVLIERHGLTVPFRALQSFPGGWSQYGWLTARLNRIMGPDKPVARKRATGAGAKAKAAGTKAPVRPAAKAAKSEPRREPAPAPPAAIAPSGLPRLDIDLTDDPDGLAPPGAADRAAAVRLGARPRPGAAGVGRQAAPHRARRPGAVRVVRQAVLPRLPPGRLPALRYGGGRDHGHTGDHATVLYLAPLPGEPFRSVISSFWKC
jgi:hypothetical protein